MPEITPTVGRKVYYYAGPQQTRPHDATIILVHASPETATPDSYVNLSVSDPESAEVKFVSSVKVGDESSTGPHYRWMPYQLGQAAQR